MFNEVPHGCRPGLVFPAGGTRELHSWLGAASSGVRPAVWASCRAPSSCQGDCPCGDGRQASRDTEYFGAGKRDSLRPRHGRDAKSSWCADQPDDQNLYVAVRGLRDVPSGRARADSWFAVSLDVNGSRDVFAQLTDLQFRGFLGAQPGQMWVGDGEGGYTQWTILPGPTKPWEVAYGPSTAAAPPDMEFRIARPARPVD